MGLEIERLWIRMGRMAKKKPEPYLDTLGKRDVVKLMLSQKMTLSEICRSIGCTREDLSVYYDDLIGKYHALEHIPTDEDRLLVGRWYAYGITKEEIAGRLGVSTDTLNKYYTYELRLAKAEWVAGIAGAMTAKALGGDVSAGSFLLKTKGGWKETQVNEHTGKDGAPLAAAINITVGQPQEN